MKKKIDCQTLEMIPNYSVKMTKLDGSNKPIELHSNVFVDVEFCELDDVIVINIVGLPKIKNIIYG